MNAVFRIRYSTFNRHTAAMPHSFSDHAIVLRVYDVGEADRYCVLLTREHGRLAARARAVRKPKSKMGGSLLPYVMVEVELVESSAGFLIRGATHARALPSGMEGFVRAVRAAEMLLLLLHDGEPVPEIFHLTEAFLKDPAATAEGFTLCLLHALGLLPESEHALLADLSSTDRTLVDVCVHGGGMAVTFSPTGTRSLQRLTDSLIEHQSSRRPRASEALRLLTR